MKLKKNVKLLGVKSEILLAMKIVDDVYKDVISSGATITSVVDGTHGRGSFHYKGLAFDVRTRNDDNPIQWDVTVKNRLVDEIRNRLNDEFDVVLEKDHIHVEWDPKR